MSRGHWLREVRGVLLDVDGVLYRGREILPGAHAFLQFLAAEGVPFVYVTNNSTLSPEAYAERLTRLGFPATPAQVVGSAEATAHLLKQTYPSNALRLLVIGETGLFETLQRYGFTLVDDAASADAVVVGLDRRLSYARLAEATYALRRGVPFYGTNPDRTFPTERGLAPGAGAILALLQAASDRDPQLVGKPERPIFELALERLGLSQGPVVMIGDRLDTDILGAKRLGLRTVLVLTGVTPEVPPPGPQSPDLTVATLQELHALWQQAIMPAKDEVPPTGG